MLTLEQWMKIVSYRIIEGATYQWKCYGDNAYSLQSWDHDPEGVGSNIIFDTHSQEVYEVSVYDYSANKAYRLINPAYAGKHTAESVKRKCDPNEAWDGVQYIDVETAEDFYEKAYAIMRYEPYDTRVEVPLTLDNVTVAKLMQEAHRQDITFNQLVNNMLRSIIADNKEWTE